MGLTLIISVANLTLPSVNDTIFQPDTMMPKQWAHHWHASSEPDPEHRLVLAVLEDAIRCAKSAHVERYKSTPARCIEAQRWFEDPSIRPFSFIWCCQMVGWNPDEIRKGVIALPPQRRFARRRPNVRYGQVTPNR